jgi:hypothetical protein
MFKKALEAADSELYPDNVTRSAVGLAQRYADAIGLVAECALSGGMTGDAEADAPRLASRPACRTDRLQVVVHVDAETLPADSTRGESMLESGQNVPAGTSRRIACDSSKVVMTHAADGSVLDVGRRTRTISSRLRLALEERDKGCRFPGCNCRWTDSHHVKHWADGGETKLDNLVLLCKRDHRAVHEEGFTVAWEGGEGGAAPELVFRTPTGERILAVPPPPAVPSDPVAAFQLKRAAEDIWIDPHTTTPLWAGEKFDLHWTISALWRPRGGTEPGEEGDTAAGRA